MNQIMSEPEDNLSNDIDEMEEAVENALDELSRVKAYSLTLEELRDFKAAQYALRNIVRQYYDEDVPSLYESDVVVTANEREIKEKQQ